MDIEKRYEFLNSIYLDTKDMTSGTYNNYVISPPLQLVNFTGLAVKKVSMTWNVYNVQALNGTFSIIYNSVPYSNLVVPPGNYNATSFATALQTLLQTVDPSFMVTYNSLLSTYTITAAMGFSFQLLNNPRFASLVGLIPVNSTTGTSLTSTYPINIQFTQYFDIVSNELLRYGFASYPSNKINSKILKRVYVNDIIPFGNINIIYDVPRIFSYAPLTQFADIDISMYDMYGKLLDTQNSNLSIQIDIYR